MDDNANHCIWGQIFSLYHFLSARKCQSGFPVFIFFFLAPLVKYRPSWHLTYTGKTCHYMQSHAKVMHPTSSYREQRNWVSAGRVWIIQSHELRNVRTILKTDRMIKCQHAFKKSLCCLCILVRLWCKLFLKCPRYVDMYLLWSHVYMVWLILSM